MNPNSKAVRLIGTVLIALGALMVVAGATTWGLVRSQLVAESITVAEDASSFAGQRVDSPWTAFAQADIINHHALGMTENKTYAELDREDPLRATVMNASFLRTSLFSSVIAFGVAAFAGGMGIALALTGLALRKTSTAPAAVREDVLTA